MKSSGCLARHILVRHRGFQKVKQKIFRELANSVSMFLRKLPDSGTLHNECSPLASVLHEKHLDGKAFCDHRLRLCLRQWASSEPWLQQTQGDATTSEAASLQVPRSRTSLTCLASQRSSRQKGGHLQSTLQCFPGFEHSKRCRLGCRCRSFAFGFRFAKLVKS